MNLKKLKRVLYYLIPSFLRKPLNKYRDKLNNNQNKNHLEEKFKEQYNEFKNSITKERFTLKEEDFWKILDDNTDNTKFSKHYVYHTSWAARKLVEIRPKKHVDISSCIRFIGVLSAFIPVKFFDYRPAKIELSNLESEHADIINLPFEDNSINSLSCMHVVEHIGLGRYGEPIDYDGDLKAISELKRVLAPNGNLLFVVPVASEPKIQYNAHRLYTKKQVLDYFLEFELIEYSLIEANTDNSLIKNPSDDIKINDYSCGCFWFRKK